MANKNPGPSKDMLSVPLRLYAPGYRGPNQSLLTALLVGISVSVLGFVWAVSYVGHSNANEAVTPIKKLAPHSALADRDDPPAVVVPDPTTSPGGTGLFHFADHPAPAAPPPPPQQPTTTRVEIHQAASDQIMVPRLNADEQRLASDSAAASSSKDQNRYSMVMHLDTPPPSQDAQAQADIAAASAHAAPQIAQANAQEEEHSFINRTSEHVGYVPATSDNELWAATTISCRLETAINSEIPGIVRARVTMPVYDSHSHNHIVIPAGTMVAGTYASHVIGGQSRLLVSFQRLYFPDGKKFDMGSQESADALGASGMAGRVDNHTGQVVRTGLLMTLLGVGATLLNPPASLLTTQSVGSQIGQAAGGEISQIASRVASRQLEQGPTISISPPYDFQIMLLNDLPLQRYAVQ